MSPWRKRELLEALPGIVALAAVILVLLINGGQS